MHQPSLFDSEEPPQPPAGDLPRREDGIDFPALWAQMPAREIPHLLGQASSLEGRRKIADMISRNRPELSDQVETALASLALN